MNRTLTLLVTLGGAALIGWLAAATPTPLPMDAPATAFSAMRAMGDIRAIASTPHATGTPALASARAHLTQRLTALGFSWRTVEFPLPARAAKRLRTWGGDSLATGVNIIAWRRGTAPGADSAAPAVALMAHYDGVWGSPAAADDAFGVATALEIARAIPPETQRRDLILVLTDAEELGLVGARAFIGAEGAPDPLASRVGVMINLESRGGGGLTSMFQTSRANGALMQLYREVVRHPAANSIAVSIYERLPNNTDLTPVLEAGVRAFNIANVGDARLYHSPLATPDAIDPGTVQHMGDQALDLTRALLTRDALPVEAPPAVFSDVFGLTMLAYAPQTGWFVLGVCVVLLGGAAYQQRASWRAGSVFGAAGESVAVMLVGGVLLWAVNRLSLTAISPEANYYDRLAALPRLEWQALLVLLATLVASIGVIPARQRSVQAGLLGTALVTLALAVSTQQLLPGGGPLFTWPLAAAALSLVVMSAVAVEATGTRIALMLIATTTLAWLGGFAHFLLLGVGADLPFAVVPLLAPAAMLLAPLRPSWPRQAALMSSGVFLLCAMALALWVRLDALAPSVAVYATP